MKILHPLLRRSKRALLPLFAVLIAAPYSHATVRTWTDQSGDNTWGTAGNWSASGAPGSSDTLVFDTGGTTSPIKVGATSVAKIIEFGATTSSSSTLAYTLGTSAHSGTITISTNSGLGTNLTANILYEGSSTAAQTINSDIVFTTGTSPGINIVNTNTAGALTINGNISNGSANGGSIVVKGSGNINLNGTIGGASGSGNVAASVLTVATSSGTLAITGSNTAPTGNIALGNSTYSGGNVLIETSNPWGNKSTNLLNLSAGATGAFQLEGTPANPNLTLPNAFNTAVVRAAGDAGGAADIENISGNNSIGVLGFGPGITSTGYLNVESDAGSTLTVAGVTDSRTTPSVGTETVLFYGSGNGVVSGAISDSTVAGDNVAVAKDGTGTLALTAAAGNTYSGGTTVSGGVQDITNTSGSATGSGVLTVSGGATLAGTGIVTTTGSNAISIQGNGTTTGARANVLVGVNSSADTTTTGTSLTLNGAGGATIADANLTFNISSTSSVANTELNVGSTVVSFGTGTGSTLLTLNISGNQVIAANTPFTLIAGTGTTNFSGATTRGQFAGLTVIENSLDQEEIVGSGNDGTGNLQLALFGSAASFYGGPSYLFIADTATGDEIDVEVVPEPGTWTLLLAGLGLTVIYRKRGMYRACARRQS